MIPLSLLPCSCRIIVLCIFGPPRSYSSSNVKRSRFIAIPQLKVRTLHFGGHEHLQLPLNSRQHLFRCSTKSISGSCKSFLYDIPVTFFHFSQAPCTSQSPPVLHAQLRQNYRFPSSLPEKAFPTDLSDNGTRTSSSSPCNQGDIRLQQSWRIGNR